jgi:PQQ-like domain/PQQ enzyme repeat
VWRNTKLVPRLRQKGGGELASGFGIDIQPQVANGTVYLSSAALLGGGFVYALDAATGRTRWSFDSVIDPIGEKIIAEAPGTRRPSVPTGSSTSASGTCTNLRRWRSHVRADDRTPTAPSRWTARRGSSAVWKTKVGVHNGHDDDGTLALQHKLELRFPLRVEPGIVGGVETPMAVADGVVYVPVANLASEWKTRNAGLGNANFAESKGEMTALDLASGRVLWDTKLPQMPDGAATVANDLVFTTTFDGYVMAFKRKDGSIAWKQKLPAFWGPQLARHRRPDRRRARAARLGHGARRVVGRLVRDHDQHGAARRRNVPGLVREGHRVVVRGACTPRTAGAGGVRPRPVDARPNVRRRADGRCRMTRPHIVAFSVVRG